MESHQSSSGSWAPGTVQLEDIHGSRDQIVLHPRPSQDPNDPLNWSRIRKAINFAFTCVYVLFTFVALDIGWVVYQPYIDMGISYPQITNSTACNYVGLATGCILFIPFAFMYGRRPIYILSLAIQLGSAIWQAKVTSASSLIAANFFLGIGGAISETIVQMTIADLFFVHQHATMNALFLAMQLSGAYLGPAVAGYIADLQGWQWIWWYTAILMGANLVLVLGCYEETKYTPVHMGESQNGPVDESAPGSSDKSKTSNDLEVGKEMTLVRNASAQPREYRMKTYRERMAWITKSEDSGFSAYLNHIKQPLHVLVTFPAVTYAAIIYGALLSWYSVLANVEAYYLTLPPYNFSSGQVGLLNIAPFIGCIIGALLGGPLNDYVIIFLSRRNGGVFEPEMRLWLALPTVLICPAGILTFGIALARGLHWSVIGGGWLLFSVGMTMMMDVSLTYVLDCYPDIIGDALVGIVFCRNAFSIMIMFTLTSWIARVGLQNCFIMVACFAFACSSLTVPMMIWGKKARATTAPRYRTFAALQSSARHDD